MTRTHPRNVAAIVVLSMWSSAILCGTTIVAQEPRLEIRVLKQGGHVFALAFSGDGKLLASASDLKEAGKAIGSQVKLWDTNSGESKQTLSVRKPQAIESIAISQDGNILAAGGHSGQIVRQLDLGVQILHSIEGYEGDIKLFDTATGRLTDTLRGHGWDVSFVRFSPNDKTLVTSDRRTTFIGETGAGGLGRELGVGSVGGISPDGKTLACLGTDIVELRDAESGDVKQALSGHGGALVYSVAFSPDGTTIATGGGDRQVRLWDADKGVLRQTLEGHTDHIVWSVAFSPDGKTLVSGGQDRTVRVWDVQSAKLIRTLESHTEAVQAVAFSPNGTTLATGSVDMTIRLWNASLILSQDGKP